MHDNWLRMLQNDDPPKSSWKPRKSTKSWDQLSVQKIHTSHTVTEKGPAHGKIWSYRASWRGGHVPKFAMRQQRKDVSPKYKEAQRELRCYFCKEYISNYRKSQQKWLRNLQELHHDQWGQQSWHKVHHQQWHEQSQRARPAQVSTASRL